MAIRNRNVIMEIEAIKEDMHTTNSDCVISIFGKEGSGKSTLALNLAKYFDTKFNVSTMKEKFAQTFEDFARVCPTVPSYEVCWWDEAHRFSKRGSYDTDVNRIMLKYLQDIRGQKRIIILCYPEIREIDRKVTQRSRLYFETLKHGDQFYVRGWREEQIHAMMRAARLFSAKSRAAAWVTDAGQFIPQKPIVVFRCDFREIEPELEVYKSMKEGSLRRSDEELAQYGIYCPADVYNELVRITEYSYESARKIVSRVLNTLMNENRFTEDQVIYEKGKYKIKTKETFEAILKIAKEQGATGRLDQYRVGSVLPPLPTIEISNKYNLFEKPIEVQH